MSDITMVPALERPAAALPALRASSEAFGCGGARSLSWTTLRTEATSASVKPSRQRHAWAPAPRVALVKLPASVAPIEDPPALGSFGSLSSPPSAGAEFGFSSPNPGPDAAGL